MTSFIIIATIIFGLLTLIWSKTGWLDFFIKVAFFIMTIWGLILALQALGYLMIKA